MLTIQSLYSLEQLCQEQRYQVRVVRSSMAEEKSGIDYVDGIRGYLDPWPPVRGDYRVGDPGKSVAVVTLASSFYLRGAAICGPCKTENLGLEKIVANVISNSNIRVIILCGVESKGHLPGDSLIALYRNGIDEQGMIIGSKGAIPFIQNLSSAAIERFQRQVELVDRVGLEDSEEIENLIQCYGSIPPFPEEPFQVVRRKAERKKIPAGNYDLTFGAGVSMDTRSWQVASDL